MPSAGWLLLMVSTQARNIQATICHREDSLTKLQCHHRFCVHRHRRLKPEVGWEGGNGNCCRLSLFCPPPQWDLFSKLLFSFPWPPLQENYQTFGLHLLSQVSWCLPCFALANRPGDNLTAIHYCPQYQAYLSSWIPPLPILSLSFIQNFSVFLTFIRRL